MKIRQRKFTTYAPDMLLYELAREGKAWTVDSELFHSIGYAVFKDTLVIAAGKSGALSIDLENIEDFATELLEVLEMARERKIMMLKGA